MDSRIFRENEVVKFQNSCDEASIGLLRPRAQYPKYLDRKLVVVDEISSFSEHFVTLQNIAKFFDDAHSLICDPLIESRSIKCVKNINMLQQQEQIEHSPIFRIGDKERRTKLKTEKKFTERDGTRYVHRSIGYLRLNDQNEKLKQTITLHEDKSFTIGEDVLYCGNGVLFVGSLDKYNNETCTLSDSFTNISRRVPTSSVMKLDFLTKLEEIAAGSLCMDEAQKISFGTYVQDLLVKRRTVPWNPVFSKKDISLQGSIVCAEVASDDRIVILRNEKIPKGYRVCKWSPCFARGKPLQCYKSGFPTRTHRLRCHHKEFTYLCHFCGLMFDNQSSLTTHRSYCPHSFWKNVEQMSPQTIQERGYDADYLEAMKPFVGNKEVREKERRTFLSIERGILY